MSIIGCGVNVVTQSEVVSAQVTDFHMAGDFGAEVVNGPTTQDGLPPFMWDKFISISHVGLPRSYNFTFVPMKPLLFQP